MNYDDIGEISSFGYEHKEKGLLTFYEQQWDVPKIDETNKNQDKTTRKRKFEQAKLIEQNTLTRDSLTSTQLQSQSFSIFDKIPKKIHKQEKCYMQIHKRIHEPQNKQKFVPQNHQSVQKQKQKIIDLIKRPIFEKIETNLRARKGRLFESVHIKNYPFQEKEEQSCLVSKLKSQTSNIRIKKGLSFKGFNRENFSISLVEMNKENFYHAKPQKLTKLLTKSPKNYEGYLNSTKNVSNYLFPIISPGPSFAQKTSVRKDFAEYEDSLNQMCRKMCLPSYKSPQVPMKMV